ncbi:MAG: N-6 DNA methylase [Planctomycetaceae bacterium]|jgi:adenine-specific DNA-methyltransferase|nr:N-6 DNA methylase [Planctomycetaceae bacterium]
MTYFITDNSIEQSYTAIVSLAHRKKFAQFFTPFPIADLMTKWLLGNENLQTVLEPALGLGIFSRLLLSKNEKLNIKAFEIDNTIYQHAEKHFANTPNVCLLPQDYMENDWQNKYDGIICNPPYFKFHDYDNKTVLHEVEEKLNCSLTGFTNLYTLFLLKSLYQLKPNGRCVYLVPSEFLNSDYGKLIKLQLIKTGMLRHIAVVDFEENVFDDALTTASIIFCANDQLADTVHFHHIRSLNGLNVLDKIIEDYPQCSITSNTYTLSDLEPNIKWKAYYQKQNSKQYKHLVPFSVYAKVVRGIATGSNDFFTFTKEKSNQYAIDEHFLLPCICKAVDVRKAIFTVKDFERLKERNKKIFLFNAENSNDKNVIKYIRKGEAEGIDKKYLTASRTPWYSLERRPPAPIWVGVFNRTGLRFIRNESGIANLTTFHCVYPQQNNLLFGIDTDLLSAYLLTDTAKKILTDNSREYGNGLQKFEPNDINKGMMLDLERLPKSDKKTIIKLYQQFRENEFADIQNKTLIDQIDRLFIESYAK